MNRNFTPRSYRKKDRRAPTSELNETRKLPETPPVTIHIFQYFKIIASPKTRVRQYTVNPGVELDLYLVRDKLNECFPCVVDLRSVMLTPWFEVVLDSALPWGVVCEKTLKAMGEIVGSV